MDTLIRIASAVARTLGVLVGWLEVQRNRRRLYAAAVLVLPLLTGASLLTDGQAQKVIAVLAVLAGAGVPALAKRHTSKRPVKLDGSEIEAALARHHRRQGRRGQAGNVDLLVLLAVANLIGVLLILLGVRFR